MIGELVNIKNLTDEQLHQRLLSLKSKESQIIAIIISHLEEVYRRRLYADHKCSSIYDYCVRILGYSNGEAHRKISACKLASQHHGVKEAIAHGELSLSNAASVQVFLNQCHRAQEKALQLIGRPNSNATALPEVKLSPRAIIERVKHKSSRECEIELEKIASESHLEFHDKKYSKRHVGNKLLLKIYLDSEKLQLLKSRLNVNCEQELLELLMDEKLNATEPRTDVKPRAREKSSQNPRNIAPSQRAIIMKRADKKCENCSSKHKLQVDHKLSIALGGSNDLENLRVLCRPCNQRAAIHQLGLKTMNQFINTH